ncbi:hypothetical protein EW145_g7176 [Phellinidium pouzarii]|uniref:AB hydrolase-1 domain-containing protein n=1 Tax=Phellinidium pouzarii TaxID=167371 RepID=A0A4S4KMX5_9AGAM|nr:hypothetical protein EW145_g7176 [Phellinidium pouzarii]
MLSRGATRLPSLCSLGKCFLSTATAAPPVDLEYDVYCYNTHSLEADPKAEKGPLIICHGLFGSKRNWQSLGKVLAKELKRSVIPLDLRNFGESPQSEQMDYATMASDVIHFCDKHSLKNISLLGHSMGGKVAMTVALKPDLPKGLLSNLIVADISPIRANLSSEFPRYVDGMIKIERNGSIKSKKEAFDKLYEYEKNSLIRHFLLTNLDPTHEGEPIKFRVPLQTVKTALPDIGWFPYEPGEASWGGPTLFVKGSKSNYIKLKHLDVMKSFFPIMEMETLEAGHWIHYERSKEFVAVIKQFLGEH